MTLQEHLILLHVTSNYFWVQTPRKSSPLNISGASPISTTPRSCRKSLRKSSTHHTLRTIQFRKLRTLSFALLHFCRRQCPVLLVSISAESNVGSCPYGPRRSWQHNNSLMFNGNRWKTAGSLPTQLFSIFILWAMWNSVNFVGSFDAVGWERLTQQRCQSSLT